MIPSDATYLGDGVYARYAGSQIWLYTIREDGVHYIAIEPEVYEMLLNFADGPNIPPIYSNIRKRSK